MKDEKTRSLQVSMLNKEQTVEGCDISATLSTGCTNVS